MRETIILYSRHGPIWKRSIFKRSGDTAFTQHRRQFLQLCTKGHVWDTNHSFPDSLGESTKIREAKSNCLGSWASTFTQFRSETIYPLTIMRTTIQVLLLKLFIRTGQDLFIKTSCWIGRSSRETRRNRKMDEITVITSKAQQKVKCLNFDLKAFPQAFSCLI